MNKFKYFTILYLSLFLIEIIGSYLFLIFNSFDYKGCVNAVVLWNLWRLLFYGLPFILLYLLFFKYFKKINLYKPLLFSLFNLLIYVSLSNLSTIIWGNNVPLPPEGIMFWLTCLSIFLSPIILGRIPYFKKIMESLLNTI